MDIKKTIEEAKKKKLLKENPLAKGVADLVAPEIEDVNESIEGLREDIQSMTDDPSKMATLFFKMFKGEKGDTPEKGKDYFTEEEVQEIIDRIEALIPPMIPEPIPGDDGHTPIRGVDYFTEKDEKRFLKSVTPVKGVDYDDGKDAVVDYHLIVSEAIKQIPPAKDGRTPKHEIEGLKIRFENPDGTMGNWIDFSFVRTLVKASYGGGGVGVIKDAGTVVKTGASEINFGDNLTVTVTEHGVKVDATGGSAGHSITDEGGAALTARTNLNFIGATVAATDNAGTDSTDITITAQPLDSTLTSIAALGTAADKFAYTTGVDTWAEASITAAGRAILDDATAGDQRTTLGLGTMATETATDYVAKALFDAHTVIYATTDNTPVALTVTEQTVVGRATGGNITALAIDSDLSAVSANDDTIPSAKATKTALDAKASTALSNLASVAINTDLISDTDVTDDLGSLAVRWDNIFAQALNTGDTAGDTLKLRGYDVNGATFVDILTITANDTVTADLHTSVTINGAAIYRAGGTDVALADGGTGASLSDPNDDRIMMWDDSAGAVVFMDIGTGLAIDATPILSVDQTTAFAWTGAHTHTVAGLVKTLTNNADSASVQVAILQGDRATMADNDEAYVSLQLSNDGGTQTEFARLTWVATDVNAGTSVDGQLEIDVVKAGSLTQIATFSGTGLNLLASGVLQFGAVTIISDSAGTTTLSNIDALDATTESTIEAAIDTLANLTSIQGRTVTLADAGANAIFGWDDTAGAYENLTQAEVLAVIGDSSLTAKGVIELATTAEINTGTDSARAMPIDQFVASNRNVRYITYRCIEKATDWSADGTTGVGGDWVCPFTGTIVDIEADVDTAGTTGTAVVDANLNGSTIMTTNKLKWDSTEKSTRTYSGTAPGLTTTAVTAGDIFTFDIDTNHTTKSKGLTVFLAIRLT